jgi:hypothetical protein
MGSSRGQFVRVTSRPVRCCPAARALGSIGQARVSSRWYALTSTHQRAFLEHEAGAVMASNRDVSDKHLCCSTLCDDGCCRALETPDVAAMYG